MAETVPDDVILEILAKLRLKSLLRFKCLCRTWYTTISDPQFSNKLPWIQPSVLICQNSKTFSTITIESLLTAKNKSPTPLSLPWEDTNPLPSEAPRLAGRDGNYFIGSCNGLVCVHHKSSKSGRDDLILWNPSVGTFRRLPRCPQARKECDHYVWFGYDELIHDYKLVWVVYQKDYPEGIKLNVFTLKSNAWRRDWRRVSDWPLRQVHDGIGSDSRSIGVLSDGAIHWRTKMNRQIVILALDLATEKFKMLDDFANYPFDPRGGGSCLVGGCSCLYDAGIHGEMNLQIMRKYGLEGIVLRRWEPVMYYPILFTSGKEILAVFNRSCYKHRGGAATEGHRIIKFRIEEGAGEKVSCPETLLCIPGSSNVVLLEESLVSLGDDLQKKKSYSPGWEILHPYKI